MDKNILKTAYIFIFFKAMGMIVISGALLTVPYLGFFPYRDQLASFHLPRFISAMANFDGIHYLLIARNGYSQFEQAFFPLFPLLIKYLTPVFFNNGLIAGLFLSNFSFLLGLFVIYKATGVKYNLWLLLFIFSYPMSFFFGAVYNEGLFFLLFLGCLYFLRNKNYPLSAASAFLAALTRLVGVFLIIPIGIHWIFSRAKKSLYVIFAPLLGLATYCLYLWQTTGDPLYFLSSQPAFGANRSTHLILLPQVYWRYLKIFVTANHDFRYFISVFEFVLFNFVFMILVMDFFKQVKLVKKLGVKVVNYERLGLNLFSLANIILPTLTGTLSSVPRYALLSVSFFLYLAEIKSKWAKIFLALVLLLFHVFMVAYFVQGYFVS